MALARLTTWQNNDTLTASALNGEFNNVVNYLNGSSLVLTTPDINGGTADSLTSLSIRSTGAAFDLLFATAAVFTQNRTLTLVPGDANRILTLTGDLAMSGAFNLTHTITGNTNVTYPTSGTLATLAGAETLSNKSLTSLTSLSIRSTGAAFDLLFAMSEAISANRTITWNVGNASRAVTLTGDLAMSGAFGLTLTVGGTTNVTLPTTGTLATLAGTETLSGKTLSSPIIRGSAVVALSDGATPALDAALGNVFTLAAGGNRTIAVPSNATNGQKIIIRHLASGAARTLALNTGAGGFRFGTDITALTETASGKTDYIGCIYSSIDSFFDVVAYSKGY